MTVRGIVGRVRGLMAGNYPENREDEQFHLTPLGDQQMVQGLPERAEIVRHGDSWQAIRTSYTALTALPTTAFIMSIWNGEPDNGKSYVIDSVFSMKIAVDTIQVDSIGLFVQLVRPPVAPVTDAGLAIVSLSGRKSYDGRARLVEGGTAISGRWDLLGDSPQNAPALAGTAWQMWDVSVYGKYIVPPGGVFGFHRAEVTATANKFRAGFRWHEVRLPLLS